MTVNAEKLIEYKNKLLAESEKYYDWASVNDDELEREKELALSKRLREIANDLKEIIYG